LRETTMALASVSPSTRNVPALKDAVTASITRGSSGSTAGGTWTLVLFRRRTGRASLVNQRVRHDDERFGKCGRMTELLDSCAHPARSLGIGERIC
jgi:hypothetical protein